MNEFSKWFEIHPKLQISMMDHLYNRLDGAYPHKWRSNFPNQIAIDNWSVSWAEAFEEEKITLEEVAKGLKHCRKNLEWPPSIAEFIKACRPTTDPLKAYYEAVAGCQARQRGEVGEWSHPAIFWAAMPLSFELQNQTYSQIKHAWESAFNAQLAKGNWEKIPDPDPAPVALLAAPPKRSEEQVMRYIGVAKALKPRTDHRAWIEKVLNDKNAPMIAKKFAREAQGIKEHDL